MRQQDMIGKLTAESALGNDSIVPFLRPSEAALFVLPVDFERFVNPSRWRDHTLQIGWLKPRLKHLDVSRRLADFVVWLSVADIQKKENGKFVTGRFCYI